MENKAGLLKDIAQKLAGEENCIELYKTLIPIFEDAELYQEQAGLLEKIYNITKEPELYREIGDIMLDKIGKNDIAKNAYNKYLSLTKPEFFNKYISIIDPGYNQVDEEGLDFKLLSLIDRYNAVIYIMVYFFQRQMYADILEISPCIDIINQQIDEHLNTVGITDFSTLEDKKQSDIYISTQLARTSNHNDINRLAIKFNPQNEAPYLNIIDDLVEYNNYNQALDFYNNDYCAMFPDNRRIDSIVGLCWFLSDKYSAIGEYYNAVQRQKKAIELELGGGNNE